jgi:hypothetical protein
MAQVKFTQTFPISYLKTSLSKLAKKLHLVKCPKNTLHTSACRGHYGQGKAFFVFLDFQAQLIAPGWTLKSKKAPKGVPPLYIMIPSRKSNSYVKRGSRSQLKDLMLKGELDDFNYTQRVF